MVLRGGRRAASPRSGGGGAGEMDDRQRQQQQQHQQPLKKRQRTRERSPSGGRRRGGGAPFWGDEFRSRLVERRCLCGAVEQQRRARLAPLALDEWPPDALPPFLADLQLLLDAYLKQNGEGALCASLKETRDSLVRNEADWFGEVARLSRHPNRLVAFLASRVLASFLVAARDDVDAEWLRVVAEPFRALDDLDANRVRDMNFALDVAKRVVEWKDVDQHPLEDSAYINTANPSASQQDDANSSGETTLRNAFSHLEVAMDATDSINVPCETITLTDSESFDTAHVKCVTIRCLERHWPTLVTNVKRLILRHQSLPGAENCALSFLSLWENIISVKANLSVIDTKPFYMDFQSFAELLRCNTLPPLVYSQLLSLFNEVLCYGSTLALQDMLPEETCTLAHSIVRYVKDFRLLNEIRIRRGRTGFNFLGSDAPALTSYSLGASSEDATTSSQSTSAAPANEETDKTTLQKMTLLVLKSVAVTVKEMRCDSSDSSIDSTDYNAIQDMQMVERSIRDVLKKLDAFLKSALDFLPDCPFTKILVRLFGDQDDYLIESMVCTLDITVGVAHRNSAFPDLVPMLNPMATFVEFLGAVAHDSDVLLDYLVSNETCFLLYLLRFLKYARRNWPKFVAACRDAGARRLDDTMGVLIRLRHQISRLVASSLFPYNISPVLRLLETCESLYEGNELG